MLFVEDTNQTIKSIVQDNLNVHENSSLSLCNLNMIFFFLFLICSYLLSDVVRQENCEVVC
jgi:hypothetical protein